MKRLLSLALLFVLLTSLPAQAVTWFDDGEKLHRDPFCIEAAFSFSSFYSPSLECTTPDEALARNHSVLCESCTALVPDEYNADKPVVWYYNPDGGQFYHSDQNCAAIRSMYLPLKGVYTAESPTWQPENPCSFCAHAQLVLRGPSDIDGWNATPAEKAEFLPGVWTKPAAEAIHYSEAASAATNFLLSLRAKETYALSVAHYDHGGPDEGQNRPTYKVIATTVLRHPVAIVYVDALTGEVYHYQMAAEYEK